MTNTKREIVYTVDTDTVEGIKKAEAIRSRLYEKYESVLVYPNGLYQIKIVATNSK